MRFLVLLTEDDHFARWEALDDAERERAFADYRAFSGAVRERGSILAGDALHEPGAARTVRPGPERAVTEGPYAETVEQLGGFYLIDVPTLADALAAARLLPEEYTIEVRPTLEVEV
ncbi:YciI family protein [Nocardioides mangrovi]|uniref:YciI family protein n=1 Tax=Nocardioides mangrovi TaxID=2874580 RepID=A0ABS7UCC6_9ACTN|nr:YciI family protein [Nocardioides mangrovi]MBZ5738631.1 YciI family protein [Nocardioides mangrovi]